MISRAARQHRTTLRFCRVVSCCLATFLAFLAIAHASEVLEETGTLVVVREHPRTGKPYVSITSLDSRTRDPFEGHRRRYGRPDYRMLDPKIKSGAIPYDGPYSDKKKIYLFAASLMTLGVGSGGAVMATAPAATGAAASGGAGAYLASGTAVVAATAGTVAVKTRPDPRKGSYVHRSQSSLEPLSSAENEEENVERPHRD